MSTTIPPVAKKARPRAIWGYQPEVWDGTVSRWVYGREASRIKNPSRRMSSCPSGKSVLAGERVLWCQRSTNRRRCQSTAVSIDGGVNRGVCDESRWMHRDRAMRSMQRAMDGVQNKKKRYRAGDHRSLWRAHAAMVGASRSGKIHSLTKEERSPLRTGSHIDASKGPQRPAGFARRISEYRWRSRWGQLCGDNAVSR